ncbi:unnamed protein product [Acanthoscelides obtectus]|uniref:Uncharacterized protein n=1 Tax=Acanthoscelides obtectus TaxID=200917 RepID=A0A9P0VU68_ACAOB|nr:unnamed protein product [Acanthoscelides obtectus]CAK1683936.1 hypothetical protein AOBTE_LOCUS34532 [Acanthoscelides obtectus]
MINFFCQFKEKTKSKFATNKNNIIKTGRGSCQLQAFDLIDTQLQEIMGPQLEGLTNNYDDDFRSQEEVVTEHVHDANYCDESEVVFNNGKCSAYTPQQLKRPKTTKLSCTKTNLRTVLDAVDLETVQQQLKNFHFAVLTTAAVGALSSYSWNDKVM